MRLGSMEVVILLIRAVLWLLHVVGYALNVILGPVFKMIYEDKHKPLPGVSDPILMQSATVLAKRIRNREIKSEAVVQAFIDRIRNVNQTLNAVVSDRFEEALREARDIDIILDADHIDEAYSQQNAPLLGVPFTAKEAFGFKGLPNTSGLLTRKHVTAAEDAAVVTNMKKAGGISLALTNCSELCMWWESSNLLYGRTNNAYHNGHIVGGSSGGEGCILTAAGSIIGVGSDIGGSIRMPSFFNGIFGHKPTTGIVDCDGQFPNATGKEKEFLVTGPMCRYACDLLPVFKVMAGQEGCAKLKLDEKVDLRSLHYFTMEDDGGNVLVSPVQPQLRAAQNKVVSHFEDSLGVKVKKVSMKKMKLSMQMWMAKMTTSESEPFCSLMGGAGGAVNPYMELLRWILQSPRHTLPAIMLGIGEKLGDNPKINDRLVRMCENLKDEYKDLLGEDGVMFYPSHPKIAPYHNQPLLTPFNWAYTGIFNVLGVPVTQCPVGLSEEGLPMGIQVVGSFHSDHLTLAVAQEIEKAFGGWVPPFTSH